MEIILKFTSIEQFMYYIDTIRNHSMLLNLMNTTISDSSIRILDDNDTIAFGFKPSFGTYFSLNTNVNACVPKLIFKYYFQSVLIRNPEMYGLLYNYYSSLYRFYSLSSGLITHEYVIQFLASYYRDDIKFGNQDFMDNITKKTMKPNSFKNLEKAFRKDLVYNKFLTLSTLVERIKEEDEDDDDSAED